MREESSTPNVQAGLPQSGYLPWTKECFVCGQDNPRGLQLRSRLCEGVVTLEYVTRDTDLGWANIVHGGLAATLLDEVMTWAAMLAVRSACVTAEWTVRLNEPIRAGEKLKCTSIVPAPGSRLVMTEGTIKDEGGATVATARGKYLPMPRQDVELLKQEFVTDEDCIDPEWIFGEDR